MIKFVNGRKTQCVLDLIDQIMDASIRKVKWGHTLQRKVSLMTTCRIILPIHISTKSQCPLTKITGKSRVIDFEFGTSLKNCIFHSTVTINKNRYSFNRNPINSNFKYFLLQEWTRQNLFSRTGLLFNQRAFKFLNLVTSSTSFSWFSSLFPHKLRANKSCDQNRTIHKLKWFEIEPGIRQSMIEWRLTNRKFSG